MLKALFVTGLASCALGLVLIVLGYGDDAFSPPLMLGGLAVCCALRDVP